MTRIKTQDLTGRALDWAVEVADGMLVSERRFKPSQNWEQAGPIIEREWLAVVPWPNEHDENRRWQCLNYNASTTIARHGPTPLIAAMRCYVASTLGPEVEIPEELQ